MSKDRALPVYYNVGLFADSKKYACCLVSLSGNCYTLIEERYDKSIAYKNMKIDLDNLLSKYSWSFGVNVNRLVDLPKINLKNCFCELIETTFNFEEGLTNLVGLIADKKLKLPLDTTDILRHLNPKDKNNHRVNALILALTDFESKINPMIGT